MNCGGGKLEVNLSTDPGTKPLGAGRGTRGAERGDRDSARATCSSSCRSRWSWDSNCLLWSSKICILASSRPLCCLRSFASAISSESSDVWWGDTTESGGKPTGSPLLRCWSFSCSYSTCKFLIQKHKNWNSYCAHHLPPQIVYELQI